MKRKRKRSKGVLAVLCIVAVLAIVVGAAIFAGAYDMTLPGTECTAVNEEKGVSLQWDAVSGATGYYVYRENGGDRKLLSRVEDSTGYKDKNVENAGEYSYSVVPFSPSGKSLKEKKLSHIYVEIPDIVISENTNDGITVVWTEIKGAESYTVYRKSGADDNWEVIAFVQEGESTYCDGTILVSDTYSYTVAANIKGYASAIGDGMWVDYIAVPKNISVENTLKGVSLSWDKVKGIDGYKVLRKSGDKGKWQEIAGIDNPDETDYFDANVSHKVQYEYKINTYFEGVESDYNAHSVKTVFLAPALIAEISKEVDGISLRWTGGESCDGYTVMRSEDGGKWEKLAVVNGSTTSYTDLSVKSGKSYSYGISRYMGDYSSGYSKDGKRVMFVATPELSVKNSPKGVRLSWTKANGTKEYIIYRKAADDNEWEKLITLDGDDITSYVDKKAVYGEKNRYKIKAYINESAQSKVRSAVSLYAVDPDKPMVALTYDDGPYAPATNSILSTLKKNNARATFFIVGSRVSEFSDCIVKADKIGCEIANHTYVHTILTKADKKTIRSEISKTNKAVESVIGKAPTTVRAPGGAVDDKVKKYVEYPLVNWSVDTLDWKYRNKSSVVSKIKDGVRDGSIVLMHDLYMSTADATKTIVPWLIDKGYQLVTVSEMMDAKGIDFKKGNLYNSAQ